LFVGDLAGLSKFRRKQKQK